MLFFVLTILAASLYAISFGLAQSQADSMLAKLTAPIAMLAWIFHGYGIVHVAFQTDVMRLGFALMLSSAFWISVLVFWLENKNFNLNGLRNLILPQTSFMCLLPLFFPGSEVNLGQKPAIFPWHIAIALLAYGTLTAAAFHAILMGWQDRQLHRRLQVSTPWNRMLDQLPALLTMEKILFRFLWIGFALLSLTVLTGVIFSEQFLGVAFKWNHKTLLSLMSWGLFAVLLGGRSWKGWRGRRVLTFTLTGFVLLLLAYVGSRFVLEVVLHRGVS